MKYIILLLLSATSRAAPLVQPQDVSISSFSVGGLYVTNAITASSMTISGNQFSVGSSSFSVSGGSTTIGGLLHIGMTNTTTNACSLATTCVVTCPTGTFILAGGCLNGTLTFGVSGSYPGAAGIQTWTCDSTGAVNITAYAICSRITN